MKYGICQWNLPVNGVEGCYVLKALGLDGMELDYSDELLLNVEDYIQAAQETCVEFPTMGMNVFCNKSYIIPGSEKFFEEEIEKALSISIRLGVKTIQIPAFFASDIKTEDDLRIAAKNLKKACQLSEKYNINIGTENALDSEMNLKLFSLVDHPLFNFYFDNQNLWRMKGKTCAQVLESMKRFLIEVHAKDSLIKDDKQLWMPLGTGDAEFYSSMKFLKSCCYDGWIHLENDYQINYKNYDYETAIRNDLKILKDIFN